MDVRLIDSLMENHFTDEVDGKTCVVNRKDSAYNWSDEYDLTFLELRIELQEAMIYDIADDLDIVSRSLAAELTERSEAVDEYIYEAYGYDFYSPITGEETDMAEYCFVMEPSYYYNIAQAIIAARMDEAIQELETTGCFSTNSREYKLVENKEETV